MPPLRTTVAPPLSPLSPPPPPTTTGIATTATDTPATKDYVAIKSGTTTKSSTSSSSSSSSSNNNNTSSSSNSCVVNRPRYGSRKRFYTHIWNTLRSIDPKQLIQQQQNNNDNNNNIVPIDNNNHNSTTTNTNSSIFTKEQDELFHNTINNSEMVQIQDRFLVSDMTLFTMAQMKTCTFIKEDQIGRCKPGYGRYFPLSLRSLIQADACQQMIQHISNKCIMCPLPIKLLLNQLIEHETTTMKIPLSSSSSSSSSLPPSSSDKNAMNMTSRPLLERNSNDTTMCNPSTNIETITKQTSSSPENHNMEWNKPKGKTTKTTTKTTKINKYGSRRIFFRRVWSRLHGVTSPEVVDHTMMFHTSKILTSNVVYNTTTTTTTSSPDERNPFDDTVIEDQKIDITIPWDRIVGKNNRIVNIETDRPPIRFHMIPVSR